MSQLRNCFCVFIFVLLTCQAQSIRLQLKWKHQFQFAGYYQAKEQGYYQKSDLEVEFLERRENVSSIDQVLNSKAEFGVSSINVLYSYLMGEDIVLVSTIYQYNPLVLFSKAGEKFQDPKNYDQSRLMLYSKNSGSLSILMMLKNAGVNLDKIHFVPFDMEKLRSKDFFQVDAYSMYLTDINLHNNDQISRRILKPSSYGISVYGDLLFTRNSFAKEFPLETQRFKEATLKGWQYALSHPHETIQLIQKKYNRNFTDQELFDEYEANQGMVQESLIPIGNSNPKRW